MNPRVLFILCVIMTALLNLGVIRRNEDPVRDTQTDPITYKQKMEQEKDGVKGPLLYHVKNSPLETFFIDPPYAKGKPVQAESAPEAKPAADLSNWWEEQPTDVKDPPTVANTGSATTAESQRTSTASEESQTKDFFSEKAAEQLFSNAEKASDQPSADTKNATPSGSKEDYWW